MKKLLLICAAILLVSSLTLAETKSEFHYPKLFKSMQLTFAVESGIDWGMSCVSINKLGYRELNPTMVWSFKSPVLGVAWMVVQTIAVVEITDHLYKKNKTLGWVAVSALTTIEAYLVYVSIQNMREP